MGRALFSQTYSSAPAVRTEPEPSVEKWGVWNRFDPDSDEFFNDAEYEAFVDPSPLQYLREQDEQSRTVIVEGSGDSSPSSESSISDRGSPMAVGSDDPAILIADAYSPTEWQQRFLEAGSDWNRRTQGERYGAARRTSFNLFSQRPPRAGSEEQAADQTRANRINRPRSVSAVPAFLPPSSLRNSTTANEIDAPPRSPSMRRAINITPINIPIEPSTPSPISPETPPPSTPPPQVTQRTPGQTVVTPSPVATVSPRIYSWQRHAIPAIPTSPTLARNRDGPLTNPRARMSLARIDAGPARIRVQNAVM